MDKRSNNPRTFLSPDETARVEAAIAAAEQQTAAQIKLVLVRYAFLGLRRRASRLFARLGLHQTAQRNCVMILLVTTDRRFLVYGDRGIHAQVGNTFWHAVRDVMQEHFRAGRFGDGLCAGIHEIGQQLATHFSQKGECDELPNRIEYA